LQWNRGAFRATGVGLRGVADMRWVTRLRCTGVSIITHAIHAHPWLHALSHSGNRTLGRKRGREEPVLLAEISGNPVDNLREADLRAETGKGMELIDARHAAHHVFKAGLVGLVVGDELDGRGATGALVDDFGEVFDGDFLGVSDVHDFPDGLLQRNKAEESLDGVAHIAEATGLRAIPVNANGSLVEGALHEVGQNNAIAD